MIRKMENTPKKRSTIHICSEQEQLSRMRLILVGNGDPTTGLVHMVKSSLFTQKNIEDKVHDISDKVNEISDKYNETLFTAQSAIRAIEKYKSDEDNFKLGQDAVRKSVSQKRNLIIVRTFEIITIVIALFMAYVGFNQYSKDQNEIIEEIQKIEVLK